MDQVEIGSRRSIRASDTQDSATDEPCSSIAVQPENHLQSTHPNKNQGGDTS